jgi:rRNA maturation endonuclease Nob1
VTCWNCEEMIDPANDRCQNCGNDVTEKRVVSEPATHYGEGVQAHCPQCRQARPFSEESCPHCGNSPVPF